MTAPICTDSGDGASLVGGLCQVYVAHCFWILRPTAHREVQRRYFSTETPFYESLGFAFVIRTGRLSGLTGPTTGSPAGWALTL